jgi:hypothetical protein
MQNETIDASDPLAALSQEAAGIEAGADPSSPNPAMQALPVDTAQEWRDAAAMGCGLIVAVYPELKADWTKEVYDNLGNALDKCAQRYGWQLAEILGHPLLGLAFATWPMATSLSRVVKARNEAKAKKPAAAQAPAAASGFAKAAPGTVKIDGVAETPGFAGVGG